MTLVELVQTIGQILTALDQLLSDPTLPSSIPDWQQIYAMRVHLDNQQRQLVALSIQLDDANYKGITDQLKAANVLLMKQIGQLAKVADVISTVAKVAALADQILAFSAL